MFDKGSIVAGNEAIHRQLLKLLKSRQPPTHAPSAAAPAGECPGNVLRPEVAVLRVIVFG